MGGDVRCIRRETKWAYRAQVELLGKTEPVSVATGLDEVR